MCPTLIFAHCTVRPLHVYCVVGWAPTTIPHTHIPTRTDTLTLTPILTLSPSLSRAHTTRRNDVMVAEGAYKVAPMVCHYSARNGPPFVISLYHIWGCVRRATPAHPAADSCACAGMRTHAKVHVFSYQNKTFKDQP